MAIQTRHLKADIDHQLRLLGADIVDVRQFLDDWDGTVTPELRSWQSEWPDVVARLECLRRSNDAGDFTEQQCQALDALRQSLPPLLPGLRRVGLNIPRL